MKLLYIGICAVLIYALIILAVYLFQEKLIFQGSPLPDDFKFDIEVPFEEVYLDTPDSSRIHGVMLKSKAPKGVILYFHGNRKNIIRWGNLAAYFTQYDYDVFVIDYRGYGKSTGNRTETLLHEDALLAYDYLTKQYSESDIIIYGRSLGTGLACQLASKVKAKALILETPYHNFSEMLFERLMILPSKNIFKYKFNSADYIGKITCPIYIFHGTSDNVVPIEYGQRLAQSGNKELLKFFTIENGQHNNLNEFSQYNDLMKKILN
ncbi:alpha/beta hydrolase [Reichenbachiella sp. MALMAid0571]|uniref:alpha/beta hydrolase n=1 Tax=Reichenbachiella sp. MALMAid0571 TaxID=3143939 RepID=UPI0032DEE138